MMKRRDFIGGSLFLGAGALSGALSGCAEEGPKRATALDEGVIWQPGARGVWKGPYVQLLAPGRARIRFETRVDEETPMTLFRGGSREVLRPIRSPMSLEYARSFHEFFGESEEYDALEEELRGYIGDEAGLHVIHEVIVEDLLPGEEVIFRVEQLEGEPIVGSFIAPKPPGESVRLGWLADTMFPRARDAILALSAHSPDLILHGGDITYDTGIFDSWNRVMNTMAPLSLQAPLHFLVGNHEYESQDEINAQYDRLFSGQGEPGVRERSFALSYGGVRVIALSIARSFDELDEEQLRWLDDELKRASSDRDVREIVVAYHRPSFTFSKYFHSDPGVRDALHKRFVRHGVRLVLAGHVHAYERFEVDGVVYIVDGGGGALTYDPDERLESMRELRPEEESMRKYASRSHGVSVFDLLDSGELRIRRIAADDQRIQDEVTLPARG